MGNDSPPNVSTALEKPVSEDQPPMAQPGTVYVVDLDGTLINTNLWWESLVSFILRNPLRIALVSLWLARGRAVLKQAVAERVPVDPEVLPYNEELLAFLRKEKQRGHEIISVTGADRRHAEALAGHLGLFSEVIASDGTTDCRGPARAKALQTHLGNRRFVYVGRDPQDEPLFRRADQAILVNPEPGVQRKVVPPTKVACVFRSQRRGWNEVVRILRVHQWAKNLLIFLPALAGHKISSPETLLSLSMAFLSLCLMASATYIINDALDLTSDRRHPEKKHRPFASGGLSLRAGMGLSVLLALASLATALLLPPNTLLLLLSYGPLSLLYSAYFKRQHLVDLFVLVGLYMLRLLVGHEAAGIRYSFWFMMFFGLGFMSLALLKRFNETEMQRRRDLTEVPGRAYLATDASMLAILGVGCGIAAVVILALYLHSEEVRAVYRQPYYLAAWCPLLLFGLSRIWIRHQREELAQDPVLYLLKDPVTYQLGILGAIATLLAV